MQTLRLVAARAARLVLVEDRVQHFLVVRCLLGELLAIDAHVRFVAMCFSNLAERLREFEK
jgi:hypothetical protein